ncbi:MAG TPA: MerR family transcriptional regulator [Polyangiaceae bacterium]|nr:MerR family transcriptional regulator [Polyangiaceae bacterium]
MVSELTRLPMGTLRAWERRYGFPQPERRRDSNRRLYSAEQLGRLRQVAQLLGRGYQPSDVIHKTAPELAQLLDTSAGSVADVTAFNAVADVPALLDLLAADDAKGIEEQLRLAAAAWGAKRFVTDLAQPLAQAVGDAWAKGELLIRHEHLMTECLTTQLRALLAAHQDVDGAPGVVLGTLPGESHTLGLQMVAVYLALHAAKPRLLGANTPPAEIVAAARALGASVIGIAVSPVAEVRATRRELRRVAAGIPSTTALWVGGAGVKALGDLPAPAEAVGSWLAIDQALARARLRSFDGAR